MVLKSSARKLEHIDIVLKENVEGPLTTMFEYVFLVHQAYTELSLDNVSLTTHFLNKEISSPLIISGMTGGAPGTEKINAAFAKVAEKYRIALGVGSQRAAIEDSSLAYTFKIVRDEAPEIPVIANIGAAEAIRYDSHKIYKAVDMINADALAIHLNIAQEAVQPEGTLSFKGLTKKLELLEKELPVPIIIKEVGNGLSLEVVRKLRSLGIRYFDTEGAGGTNWVAVELFRAKKAGFLKKMSIAEDILEWGIPTAASIIEARNGAPDATIIGSGGIRTSVDAVKALRLGADLIGMARPFLRAYFKGTLDNLVESFIEGLKVVFLLTGSRNIDELRKKPVIITSLLKEWIITRNLKVM